MLPGDGRHGDWPRRIAGRLKTVPAAPTMPAMGEPYLVFAGGGTGGHLYPGLAVARAVRDVVPATDITFYTTDRPLDRQILEPAGYAQIEQPVRPVTTHPLRVPGFLWRWRRSVAAARRHFRRRRPRAVLGLGGYAAGPPVVAARALGIWTVILNPDAVPGRANRYLARRADVIAVQWEASRAHFREDAYVQAVGCPIRAEFGCADGARGRERFQLAPDRPVLVVTGASQGARTINDAIVRVWPAFQRNHPDWQLLHLCGAADEERVRAAYAAAGVSATVVPFVHEMWLALAAADAVVSRAGASTLAELTALGKPSILLPYPYHRDQHQLANAHVLADAGAALLVEDRIDPAENAGPIGSALEVVADPARRMALADAARGLGRPAAAAKIAGWLVG